MFDESVERFPNFYDEDNDELLVNKKAFRIQLGAGDYAGNIVIP